MSDIIVSVRKLLAELADRLPMSVGELEERLKEIGCSMYCDAGMVFDHSDYVSDVINEECIDEDDDCNAYSVTRYKMAWLGLTCESSRIVAVLRNLVVIEKNGALHTIAHYDLFNVVESEKLYNAVKNKVVSRVVAERRLKELLEGLRESMPFLSRLLMGLGMIGIGLKLIEEGVKR